MLGPSVTAAYAVQALAHLARESGVWCSADEIATATDVPRAYLVRTLHTLARRGLVVTRRGFRGGYRLAGDAADVTLYDVLMAVDGPDMFERCLLGLGKCSSHRACPVHPVWSRQRPFVKRLFRNLTLEELGSFERWDIERDYHFGMRGNPARNPCGTGRGERGTP